LFLWIFDNSDTYRIYRKQGCSRYLREEIFILSDTVSATVAIAEIALSANPLMHIGFNFEQRGDKASRFWQITHVRFA